MTRVSVVSAAVLAVALGLSACGSDSGTRASSSPPPPPPQLTAVPPAPTVLSPAAGGGTASLTPAQKKQMAVLLKAVECMRSKGYEMPDPTPGNPMAAPKNPPDAAKANADSRECAASAHRP